MDITTVSPNGDFFYSFVEKSLSGEFIITGLPMDCESLCNELTQRLEAKQKLTGTFIHTEAGVKLIELK